MRKSVSEPVDLDRLSVVLAVLTLGNVLFQFIDLPGHVYQLQVLGSPLQLRASGTVLLITVMIGLASTGTSLVLHDHPLLVEHPEHSATLCWILPGMLAGLSAYLLSLAPTFPIWLAGLIVSVAAVGLTVSAEHAAVHSDAPGYATARLALNVLAYLLAFAVFVVIYETRARSLVTGTLMLLTATVLAIDLLGVAGVGVKRIMPFAGIVGLIIGESTWALNYWPVSAWVGGLLLLLVFYISINVAHQHLLDQLSLSTLVEFTVVTVVVLTVVLIKGL